MNEERLRRVRKICGAFPEVTETAAGRHARFDVRGKTFAWFVDDHHGDGRLALHCKAQPGVQAVLVARDEQRFFVPPYLGPRGWIGIYLEQEPDWEEVAEVLEESYRMTAPPVLLKLLDTRVGGARPELMRGE